MFAEVTSRRTIGFLFNSIFKIWVEGIPGRFTYVSAVVGNFCFL
jgi:hypothetical protein